jgi:GNAT superfamily N-acetyltransferase
MPQLEVRRAREEDREAVLAFSSQTWEWGDYIEYVWDEWLHNPQCALFVATMDGQPIGVANIRMLNATEAWLEGMRVDPAFRQHGIASALFEAQITEALRRNALTARLITESTNTAAIPLIERGFMRRVSALAPFHAEPVTTPSKRQYGMDTPTPATAADIDDIIDYLNVSNIFPAVGGLYNQGFTAYSITGELIAKKVAAQQIYILRRWDRLDGLVMVEPRERQGKKHLFVGYIDGTTESISLIAYALRAMLPESGLEKVRANIPDLMMVRDAFVGAEYEENGSVFYTYERSLV